MSDRLSGGMYLANSVLEGTMGFDNAQDFLREIKNSFDRTKPTLKCKQRAKQKRHSNKRIGGTQYELLEPKQLLATLGPGELDPRFGDLGTVAAHVTATFDGRDEAHTGVLQPDGKLLVGGSGHVLRYNADGSLDASFGVNGAVQIEAVEANGEEGVGSIRLLPNGQILAAGKEKFTRNFVVARLNSDGSLDTTFGEDGYAREEVLAALPGRESYPIVVDMQVTSDNRIIVIGSSYTSLDNTNAWYFLATKFNPDGSVDTNFGTDGVLNIAGYDLEESTYGARAALQPDNQILVVAYNTVDFNSTVFRFDANGVLDPSFGNSGYADLDFGAANIRLLDNGQFIVAGEYFDSTRLNDDGSVDATYGDGGYSQPDVVGDTHSHALEILPSGQLQFVGRNYDGQFDDMTVARVNADGSLDTTYGTNGFYTIDTGANETAFGLVIDADGSSFVLGEWNDYSGQFVGGETVQDFAVAKLTPAGILDTSFGGDGFVTTGVVGSYAVGDSAFGVVEQADGKIIVGGSLNFQNQGDVALVRYLADGSVDTTYGDRGVAIIDIGNEIGYEFDVTMQADGKVIVAGPTTIDFDNSFAVARVNTDGTLDNTFGTNGTAVVSANGNIYATAVVVQNDGKIVIGGYGYTNEGRYILTRLNPDGSMDDDFGMQFYSGFSGTIEDLAMQGTKIIVTGGNNGDAAATLRINEDGTRDFTFGNNGVAFTNLSFQYESGTEVVVQPDNKIVIASSDRVGNTSDWAVERYNANGTLDTSFGNNGLFTLDVTGGFDGDALNTLALQADGKILIGGHSDNQFKVGRLNSNGTLDTSFGDSGITTASFGSQRANERVNDVTVLSNGDTIAVGQIDPGWAIARILGNETVVDPVAVNDAFSTLETDVVVGNLFADNGFGADFDYLGQAFTVTQVNGLPANVGSQIQLPSGALLTVMADGNFAYDPNGQFDYLDDGEFDSDVFSYEISTDAASHDTAIVTVTIEGVTNFSVVADVLASEMNTRLNYDSSVNDTVSESAIYTIFEAPQHGAISMQADGKILLFGRSMDMSAGSFRVSSPRRCRHGFRGRGRSGRLSGAN